MGGGGRWTPVGCTTSAAGPGASAVRAAIRWALALKGITDPVAQLNWDAGMMVPGTSPLLGDTVARATAFINYVRDRRGVSWDGSELTASVRQADRPGHRRATDKFEDQTPRSTVLATKSKWSRRAR